MATNNGGIKLIRNWIIENGKMPDGSLMPKRKMARLIYKDNSILFNNEETVRQAINKITGNAQGSTRLTDKSLFETEARPLNPYNLPKSDESEWINYEIGCERLLVLNDIHVPYHNIPSLSATIKWGKQRKPDAVLLNGDAIDFYQLSRWNRDPKSRGFAGELDLFSDLFKTLRKEFKEATIYFKFGNHEERYEDFLFRKAKELDGVNEFQLEQIIGRRADGIEIIKDKRIVTVGSLDIIHGHEFGGSMFNPVNTARGLFLRAKVSSMQGHTHQTSEHTEQNMKSQMTTTWSVGCLCDLHPMYLRLNKWNHGFAYVEVSKSGEFNVINKRIHNGIVL